MIISRLFCPVVATAMRSGNASMPKRFLGNQRTRPVPRPQCIVAVICWQVNGSNVCLSVGDGNSGLHLVERQRRRSPALRGAAEAASSLQFCVSESGDLWLHVSYGVGLRHQADGDILRFRVGGGGFPSRSAKSDKTSGSA